MENLDMFDKIRDSYENKGTILIKLEDDLNPFNKGYHQTQ